MKRLLNVGGFSKEIPLPPQYDGWEHLLLDIDARNAPDIVCDARELHKLPARQFDAVYCAHNLEHYYAHEVQRVLRGFRHVLRDDGFVHIIVPDLRQLMEQVITEGVDVDEVLYHSAAGPVRPLDVLYGLASQVEASGQDYWAHKTGFTRGSLLHALERAGFRRVYSVTINLEVRTIAFVQQAKPDQEIMELFNLLPDEEYHDRIPGDHHAKTSEPPQKGSDTRQC